MVILAKKLGEGIPIPDVIDPPESMAITICIPRNRDHMVAFWGALYQLTMWNSWQQTGDNTGAQVAAVWWRYFLSWNQSMSEIDCEDNMQYCCIEPTIIKRVNPETGRLEQSIDNGATWQLAAGGIEPLIIRPMPPVTSGVAADKCNASKNVAVQMDAWITQVETDFDTAISLVEFTIGVLEAMLFAVLAVLSAGTLTPLEAAVLPVIGAAAAAAYGAGKAAFVAYWTTAVRKQIRCAAYCHIGDDGSYTDAQFTAFWTEINSELSPSPAKMLFMGFLSSVGVSGINAMAASGLSSGATCSDCDCGLPCAADNWSKGIFYGGVEIPTRGGTIVDRGSDYIVIKAAPRGDGDDEISLFNTRHNEQCAVFWQFVTSDFVTPGGVPSSVLKWYNPPPATAALEEQVRNDLLVSPVTAAAFYFQMTAGETYCRFTFI